MKKKARFVLGGAFAVAGLLAAPAVQAHSTCSGSTCCSPHSATWSQAGSHFYECSHIGSYYYRGWDCAAATVCAENTEDSSLQNCGPYGAYGGSYQTSAHAFQLTWAECGSGTGHPFGP